MKIVLLFVVVVYTTGILIIGSEKIHKAPSILMHTKDKPNRNIFELYMLDH